MMEYRHTPVMLNEVIKQLDPQPGENFIDCTLGGGGYTMAIAKKILPDGKVLAIDLDEMAINNLKFKILNLKLTNVILVNDNFKNLQQITEKYFNPEGGFAGIVLDLGLSRAQLQDRSRGFSFSLADAPLGMNFGGQAEETAESIINSRSAEELAKIFRDFGEEKFAYNIARAIVRQRQINKIKTVGELANIIEQSIPGKFKSRKIHPATKVFQALRVAVNRELENLREVLPQAVSLLKPGGRLTVISYHSLEDRIVKQYFKQEARDCLCPPAAPICQCGHRARLKIISKGVLRPTEEEVLNNPSSRSARLRLAVKIHPVK